ncbi:hypothetical protein H0X10_01035 [Candidatus Saccharibacteria bacterium]|nr:hypothetical protein [Candidatus Saccharibacteria bacterium]
MELDSERIDKFESLALSARASLPIETFESIDEAKDFVEWCLEGGYNEDGIEQWWLRPRTQLNGHAPAEVWPEQAEQVIGLAGWMVNHNLEHRP